LTEGGLRIDKKVLTDRYLRSRRPAPPGQHVQMGDSRAPAAAFLFTTSSMSTRPDAARPEGSFSGFIDDFDAAEDRSDAP